MFGADSEPISRRAPHRDERRRPLLGQSTSFWHRGEHNSTPIAPTDSRPPWGKPPSTPPHDRAGCGPGATGGRLGYELEEPPWRHRSGVCTPSRGDLEGRHRRPIHPVKAFNCPSSTDRPRSRGSRVRGFRPPPRSPLPRQLREMAVVFSFTFSGVACGRPSLLAESCMLFAAKARSTARRREHEVPGDSPSREGRSNPRRFRRGQA